MSLYSLKASQGGMQPWSEVIVFGKHMKDFYENRGDVVLVGDSFVSTRVDGPEKVVAYNNLTVGDGVTATALTTSQRCKGLTVLVTGNLRVKNNATISMTARSPRIDRGDDPRFPFGDFIIPDAISLASAAMSKKDALALIAQAGLAPWDRGFWDVDGGLLGLTCGISQAGSVKLIDWATPGGSGGAGAVINSGAHGPGNVGGAGANGCPGGGGGGGAGQYGGGYNVYGHTGGRGCPYGGGSGGGGITAVGGYAGVYGITPHCSEYCGFGGPGGIAYGGSAYFPGGAGASGGGGGAGNPGGPSPEGAGYKGSDGTGGKLTIICYGTITVDSGGKIQSNGSSGGSSAYSDGGGGSGGGSVFLISPDVITSSGTIQAAGGSGGGGSGKGGDGGAGSVVTKTFAQMGW